MPDLELLVRETLERQVPLRETARPDWADVLRRAEIVQAENGRTQLPAAPAATHRRPRRRLLLAAAVVLVAAAAYPFGPALAGLGRDAFDGLGSWLRGEPGTPAPAAEQAGFSERNAASYASFPSGTKLRLLLRPTAGGKTFALLGFRTDSSLCLRLVRSDRPEARGANECVTLRELTRAPAPALVVSEAWFSFGDDAIRVEGVFGFADDTVTAVELRRVRSGWRSVDVSSNVFVALRARPSGSVKNPGPFDPIVQVRAVRHDGERVRVPFVAGDSAVYAQGLPRVPSYLKHDPTGPGDLPGPARVEVRFPGGTIAWLEAREPRGEPFTPDRRLFEGIGSVLYARKIQPDPDNPIRVGVSLVRVGPRSRWSSPKPGQLVICSSELQALARGGAGFGCPGPDKNGPLGRPLLVWGIGPKQLTGLTGLAADGVAAIDLYLASGRVVPAALRDNAFVVQAPTIQLPGKLVAYDDDRRVIGIHPIGGASKPAPCPPASFPVAPPRAAEPYERIDLGTARIDGHEIFGRSVAEVIAALGRPDRIAYFGKTNNVREPTLFYGGTRPGTAALQIRFGYRQGRLRAFSIHYENSNVVDARLGHVLRMQPLELQRQISAAYGSRWKLGVAYGSRPGYGCVGSFDDAHKTVRISFGVNPYGGSRRPTLGLWHGY
jgi:hypothetical protein